MDLPEGWSMFGYSCFASQNMEVAFSPIVDKIIIIKDENGHVYIPDYEFNGIGNLIFGKGYQIKLTEEVLYFSLCPTIIETE